MPGNRHTKRPASDAGEKKKGNIMEIILSKQCESLTGSLGKGYGYYIRRAPRKDGSVRFFSQRTKHPPIPPDGHLRFIFACAELAQLKTHIADIRVSRIELSDALSEAGYSHLASRCPVLASSANESPDILSAADIINFRRDYLPNPA